ncbi:hypothetical protein [Ekhidna sp.]|uniref:hypothetical protein n=1 Tax=Ekhidna sp. TaxID=2608089 RepID=UPI003C799294
MKKVWLIATLVAIFGCANAQTDRGKWLIGASSSLGYSSTSYDEPGLDKTTSFNIEGVAGYFVIDNLAAGLNIGYDKEKQGDDGNTTTLIGPFVRYYANGIFFLGASYSSASREDVFARAADKFSFRVLAFEAGYPIWIIDQLAIEPTLNYGIATGDEIVKSKTFGLSLGLNVYL